MLNLPTKLLIMIALLQLLPAYQTSAAARLSGDCLNISYGITELCTLTTAAEIDTFSLAGTAGDHLLLRMARSNGNIQPRIRIIAPSTTTVCQVQNTGTLTDSSTCTLPTTDTYSVQVDSLNGTGTGGYGLSIQRLNPPAGATPIAMGQSLSSALIAPSEIDSYSFSADAGDSLIVRMASSTSSLNPLIRVFRADGALLCSASSFGQIADLGNCLAPASETYTLAVTAYSDNATGTYAIALQRANMPAGAAAIAYGESRSATLAGLAELDTYTISAIQQQTIIVRMGTTTSALNPLLRLYRPDGILLCQDSSFGNVAEVVCLIPTTGTYTLVVGAYSEPVTGGYGLSLQRAQEPAQATSLAAGILATSVFTTAGQLAAYTIPGALGDAFYLRMGALTSPVQPQIRVFSDDGALVCDRFSYGVAIDVGPCLVPHTGIYTVLVNAFATPDVGTYGVMFQRINRPDQAGIVYFGREQRGTIATSASIGTHIFSADANSSVILRLSTGSGLHPVVQIFSQDGTALCSASTYGTVAEIANCVLPATSSYTILATSIDGKIGGYTLFLSCRFGTCGAVAAPPEYLYLPFVQR